MTAKKIIYLAVAIYMATSFGLKTEYVPLPDYVLVHFWQSTSWAQGHDAGGGHETEDEGSGHSGGQGGPGGQGGHSGRQGGHSGGQGGQHSGSGKRPPAHGHRSGVHGTAEEGVSEPKGGPASGRGYRGTSHVPSAATGSAASRDAGHKGGSHDDEGHGDDTSEDHSESVSGQGLANLNVIRSLIERGDEHGGESEEDTGHDTDDHGVDDRSLRNTLSLYQQEVTKTGGDPVIAGTLLGSVAKQPVTVGVVQKINTLMSITLPPSEIETIAQSAENSRQQSAGRGYAAGHRDAVDTGDATDAGGANEPSTDDMSGQGADVSNDAGSSGGFRLGRGKMADRRQCDDVTGRRIKSGERISGRNLSRLREINRFLWPEYKAAEGPSPIFILASFQEELEKTSPDPLTAGTYLGLVTARPVDPRTIIDIASFLCVTVSEPMAINIAVTAEQQRQQSMRKKAP